jgi:DNA polymerase-3 subunit gamma/tau
LLAPSTVTVGLSLAGINPASFTLSNLVSGLAASIGADASTLNVTVTDFPVSSTISLSGSLTTLSAAALSALQTQLATALKVPAASVTLGAVSSGRRLHDVAVPVTVSGNGGSIAAASAMAAAIAAPAALAAIATAVPGATPTVATPSVSAQVAVVLTTSNAALASSASSALANPATLQQSLSTAGVSATVSVTTPPQTIAGVAPPPPGPSAASSPAPRLSAGTWLVAILFAAMISL